MSAHGAIISEDMIRKLPSQVSRITQGLLLFVGIASTVVSIAGEWSHGNHVLNRWLLENVTIMGSALHLLLVVLVVFPGRIHLLNDEVSDLKVRLIVRCLNHFYLWAWTWFWVFLGLIYVVSLFTNMSTSSTHSVHLDGTGYGLALRPALMMDAFNVGSTYFMLLGFYCLTPGFLRRYVDRAEQTPSDADLEKLDKLSSWRGLMAITWAAVVLLGIVLVGRYQALHWSHLMPTDMLVALVLGVSSALSLALFTGRMDSKFILNWQWIVVVLFLYAGLQTYTAALYEDVPLNKAIFTYGAFTMKCVLFIFVSNFFETRRVLYYALELVQADKRRL